MQNFGGKQGVLWEMCKWPIDLYIELITFKFELN